MSYSDDFNAAFAVTMGYEVGPSFNANDIAVQKGLIDTKANRRKVGYVNHHEDPGGETKFGIAQKFNPDDNVAELTLSQAEAIYHEKYWTLTNCSRLPANLNILHFDAVVNHGTKRATKFLQLAVGVTDDGSFGPLTLAACQRADPYAAAVRYLDEREAFFHRLVAARPNMKVFINGWLNRVAGLRKQFN